MLVPVPRVGCRHLIVARWTGASVPLAGGATRMVTVWRPKWGLGVPRGGGHGVLRWDGDCSHEEEQASVSHGHGIEQRGFSKNG